MEASDEQYLSAKVKALGGLSVKFTPVLAGIPDRIILLNGEIYLVEMKQHSGKLSPIQEAWHRKAAFAGVKVYVIWGKSGVRAWLQAVFDDPHPTETHYA